MSKISAQLSGAKVTDDLDIEDEISAVSVTAEDRRQILEALERL